MTGTSLDGVDAAVIRVDGSGLQATAAIVAAHSGPLDVPQLQELTRGRPMTASMWAATTEILSTRIADALAEVTANHTIEGVVVHGQTLFHQAPRSVQLVDGALIAHRLGLPVATQLRAGDLAAGGRGAPITPLGDWMLWRTTEPMCIINLGGFCNITWLPNTNHLDDIRGADVCPCNLLLNEIAQRFFNTAFDRDGQRASQGHVLPAAEAALRQQLDDLFTANRSLGTTDECFAWLDEVTGERPADIAATAAQAIGSTIGATIAKYPCQLAKVAGGGVHHRVLINAIQASSPVPIAPIDAQDPFHTYREAACMAALGALQQDGLPPTVPAVTGRQPGAMIGFQWCQPC